MDADRLSNLLISHDPLGSGLDAEQQPGQEFAFIPKGGGYLLVLSPTIQDLRGIAKGACTDNYRDRKNRY